MSLLGVAAFGAIALVASALYLALYSLGRFFVEGLRVDPAHEIGPLRLNQVVAAVVFAVSLAALHSLRGRAPQRASSGA